MNLSRMALLGLSVRHGVAAVSPAHRDLAIDEVESDAGTAGWCPARDAIADELDIPGQTVVYCEQGLDCPENPNIWRFDNLQTPLTIDPRLMINGFNGANSTRGKINTFAAPYFGFPQYINQYYYANNNELVPTKTISKRDSNGIPPLEYHPDHTKLWNEIKALPVPIPPFINKNTGKEVMTGFNSSHPLTVEDILTNSDKTVIEPGVLRRSYNRSLYERFTYKLKDIFPTDGVLILYEGKIVYEKYFSFAEEGEEDSKWANKFDRWSRHRTYSTSKSYAGTMVKMLENDFKDDEGKRFTMETNIADIIDVLKGSMWDGISVQMILDMTVSINAEEYSYCYEPSPEFTQYMHNIANATKDKYGFIKDKGAIEVPDACKVSYIEVTLDTSLPLVRSHIALKNLHFYLSAGANLLDYYTTANWFLENQLLNSVNKTRGCNETSPLRFNLASEFTSVGIRRALQAVEKGSREHGESFKYLSIITNMLAWLIEHQTEYNSVGYFSKRIWSKMGAESDATIAVEDLRFPFWDGGGMSAALRDLVRFGEMTRNNGMIYRPNPDRPDRHTAEEVIDEAIVLDSKAGGNYTQFELSKGGTATITCLVNPGAETPIYDTRRGEEILTTCSKIKDILPMESWLKAIGKCDKDAENCEGVDTGLHGTYRNQFWAIVDDEGEEQKPGGLIYQEGIRGQSIWTFDEAKLVIARVGSNAFTTSSMNVYQYITDTLNSTGDDSVSSDDVAMYRAFYEIAAYLTNVTNENGNQSKKSKAHKSTKGKSKRGSMENNIFQN